MGPFNLLDLLLAALFVSAALRGARQGALAQVAALAGAAAGLLLGAALAPRVAAAVIEEPGPRLALLTLGLLLGSFVLGQSVGLAVGVRLHTAASTVGGGGADRLLGIAVAVGYLVVVVWLLASALVQGPLPVVARQIAGSRVVTAIGAVLPPAPNVISRVGGYLQRQGFPQVFSEVGAGATAPPVALPAEGAIAAAATAATPSTVQVTAVGCGGVSAGSGFVTAPGFVVTNAHVVAGGEDVEVVDASGRVDAVPILVDADLDLAVLSAPGLAAPPIPFVTVPAARDVAGATLGYPGGQSQLVVRPAAVRARTEALGRDIYGQSLVRREILTLSAAVAQGDSGGPFVTPDGRVAGLVFAAAATEPDVGYALTAEQITDDISAAIAANAPVGTGPCRF